MQIRLNANILVWDQCLKLKNIVGSYFHINNQPDCSWKPGDEVSIGHEYNYMWRSFLEKGAFIKLNGEKLPAYKIIKAALNIYLRLDPVPLQMKDYHF